MATPDIQIGLTPDEQLYVERETQEIRKSATSADALKNKFNEERGLIEEAKRALDNRVETHRQDELLDGRADGGGSLKDRVVKAEIWVKELLKAYKNTPSLIPQLPADNPGGILLSKILEEIDIGEINPQSSPYLYILLHKIINGEITDLNQLKAVYQNILYLQIYNETLFNKLREKFKATARECFNIGDRQLEENFRKLPTQRRTQYFTYEDQREFERLSSYFQQKLAEYSNLPQSQKDKDEEYALARFVYGGYQGETDEEREKLKSALQKVGVIEKQKEEFIALLEKYQKLPLEFQKGYLGALVRHVDEAERVLRVEELIKLFPEKDGKIDFSDREARRKIKELIEMYHFRVLALIHSNPSQSFEEVMQANVNYSYYFPVLHQVISNVCEALIITVRRAQNKGSAIGAEDFLAFLQDIRGPYLSRILTNARFLHNLPLWARSLDNFEKMPQILVNLFPSQLAELFDDDGLMQQARELSVMFIGKRLATNRNFYPANLFAGEYEINGVRWGQDFRDKMMGILKKVATQPHPLDPSKTLYDLGDDEWKLIRAVTYAPAIGIIKLTDILKAGTADPSPDSVLGIQPWMAATQAVHNWGLGRAWKYVGEITRWLLGMPLEISAKESRSFLSRVWKKKKWVPEQVKKAIDGAADMVGERIWELMVTKATPEGRKRLRPLISVWRNLLRECSIPADLGSRAGFRYSELTKRDLYNALPEPLRSSVGDLWASETSWSSENWRIIMDTALRKYGASSLFWYLTSGPSRLTQELERLIWEKAGRGNQGKDAVASSFEQEYGGLWQMRTKTLEEIFDFNMGGRPVKESMMEIRDIRRSQLMGEIFFRYLRRNPGDFLILFCQMVPDLLSETPNSTVLDVAGNTPEEIRRNIQLLPGKTKREKQQWLFIFESYYDQWGEMFFTLKKVREWFIKNSANSNPATLLDSIFQTSLIATASARKRNPDGEFLYLSGEDFGTDQSQQIFNIIFGPGGLSEILTGYDFNHLDEFFSKFGDYNNFGEDNIFYRLAWVWRLREDDINPFVADTNHLKEFQYLGLVGEDVLSRMYGDTLFAYQKAINGLAQLPLHLMNIAGRKEGTEKLDEIYTGLYQALSGTIGKEYAWRAVSDLAQLVDTFFLEEDWTRGLKASLFFPFTILRRFLRGKKIAFSKLTTDDRFALTFDTNGLRRHHLHLSRELHVLPTEGAYSEEYLNKIFESSLPEFLIGDAVPQFLWYLSIFLFIIYLKKVLEEQEKKK